MVLRQEVNALYCKQLSGDGLRAGAPLGTWAEVLITNAS